MRLEVVRPLKLTSYFPAATLALAWLATVIAQCINVLNFISAKV